VNSYKGTTQIHEPDGMTIRPTATNDTTPVPFVAPRSRDAWATIRGYVYQVDLTVQRWLELEPGAVLVLECGEDIDRVSQTLAHPGDPPTVERLLEQIKHRITSVTLRTTAALEAMASALEHIQANPGVLLHVRYTTNAQIGAERLLTPGGLPGIALWEAVRRGTNDPAWEQEVISGIYRILAGARRPKGFNPATWARFKTFTDACDSAALQQFIQSFEWSTAALSADDLDRHLRDLLVQRQYAATMDEATARYTHLFLYVFKRLSQPGEKRLTVEERERHLRQPRLGDEDRALLATLNALFQGLEARLLAVEREVSVQGTMLVAQATTLTRIEAQVEEMRQAHGITATLLPRAFAPSLDVPPLPERVIERADTIQPLWAEASSHTWTALHGGAVSGKTSTGVLLARAAGRCVAWVRLRDLTYRAIMRGPRRSLRRASRYRSSDGSRRLAGRHVRRPGS